MVASSMSHSSILRDVGDGLFWPISPCRRYGRLAPLAYNLTNFMRTLALPEAVKQWSLTSLREKLVKISAKVVRHGRYVVFQMAEVAVPKELFQFSSAMRRWAKRGSRL